MYNIAESSNIEVYHDLAEAESAWEQLIVGGASHSIFQRPQFASAWMETLGHMVKALPMICVAYDEDRYPLFLLPLYVRRMHKVYVARFIGDTHANIHMGLFRPNFNPDPSILRIFLKRFAYRSKVQPDIFILSQIPSTWKGQLHPLINLSHQKNGDSYCYTEGLRHSSPLLPPHSLRELKRRRNILQELGKPVCSMACTEDEISKAVDVFLDQKNEQLGCFLSGLSHIRAFFNLCAKKNVINFHTLALDNRIVSVWGGQIYQQNLYGMITSFDYLDKNVARASPGSLLLQDVIGKAIQEGVISLDLGTGNARYKDLWCKSKLPLYEIYYAISLRGWLVKYFQSYYSFFKDFLKGSPLLHGKLVYIRKSIQQWMHKQHI